MILNHYMTEAVKINDDRLLDYYLLLLKCKTDSTLIGGINLIIFMIRSRVQYDNHNHEVEIESI